MALFYVVMQYIRNTPGGIKGLKNTLKMGNALRCKTFLKTISSVILLCSVLFSCSVLPLLLTIPQNCAVSVECCGGQEFSMACVSSFSFLLPTAADFVQGEHQALMMYCPPLMNPQAPWYLTVPSPPFTKSKIKRRPPTPSQTVDKKY